MGVLEQTLPSLSDNGMDRRAMRTRAALRAALQRIMGQKRWADVTISDICKEAKVARSSFYLHYPTKRDLMEDCMQSGAAALAAQVSGPPAAGAPYQTVVWLVDHLLSNQAQNMRANGPLASPALSLRFCQMLAWVLARELPPQTPVSVAEFAIGGCMTVLQGQTLAGRRGAVEAELQAMVWKLATISSAGQ